MSLPFQRGLLRSRRRVSSDYALSRRVGDCDPGRRGDAGAAAHVQGGHQHRAGPDHRARQPGAPGSGPRARRLHRSRQRQTAGGRVLRERHPAILRRGDDGFQLQHERAPEAAQGGRGAVHPADAARRPSPGRRLQRQDHVQPRHVHQRPRRSRRRAGRTAVRQPDAPLRRHRRQHRHAGRRDRAQGGPDLHRWRRHRQPCRLWRRARKK